MTKKLFSPFLLASLLSGACLYGQDDSSKTEEKPTPAQEEVLSQLKAKLKDPDVPRDQHHVIEKKIVRYYLSQKDLGNAIIHMQRSIDLQEKPDAQEYQALGQYLIEEKRLDEAITLLRSGQAKYPDSMDIAYLLTFPLRDQEKWKEAVSQYEKLEMLSKEASPQGLSDNFYFQYGAAVERAGDVDRAAQLFQKSLEKMPQGSERNKLRATVLNYLGYMWLEKDMNIDVAGELIKKASKLDPDSGAIADSLGWYYFKKEQYVEAMNELGRAESMMEEADPVVMDHIAQTFFKIGKKEQALTYLEKALKLDPDNKEFQARLKEYQKN